MRFIGWIGISLIGAAVVLAALGPMPPFDAALLIGGIATIAAGNKYSDGERTGGRT